MQSNMPDVLQRSSTRAHHSSLLLNCAHEEVIIQPEDERERATNQEVLHPSAPAVEVHAVHFDSLHGRVNAAELHH
jgi:hypothetical protein